MLEMLKGSFLFEADPKRIIQDPDSLRASSVRQGSAWKMWAELRDATLFQINSSDHNPTFRVGLAPQDSWELATPMMMQFHVKGGPLSNGKSGYVVSTANWDPYPLANSIEAFTMALANMDQAVLQRMFKLAIPFHTGTAANDVLPAEIRAAAAPQGNGTIAVSIWGEIDSQLAPVSPIGVASDNQANGDIESQIQLKVAKAHRSVGLSRQLLAHDLMTAAYWMDVRKVQNPARSFGQAATAAWTAYRQVSPWQMAAAERPERPAQDIAVEFLTRNPAAKFSASPARFPSP
jgi:histidine ammonia-lyase